MALRDASVDRSLILALLSSAKRKLIHSSTMDMGVTAALEDKGSLWMAWTGKWFIAM